MADESSRKCSVCRCKARQICGGCADIYYCSKEHQKQHWNTHKLHCKPYKIVVSDQLGRYLVASRNLKAGDIILREKALVIGPKQGSLPVCLSCYKEIASLTKDHFRCTGCNFPFCSQSCTQAGVHKEECQVLGRSKKRINIVDFSKAHPVYECITPLRILLMKENRPKDYQAFESLETHVEDRRDGDLWRVNQNNVVDFLRYVCQMEQLFSDEEIHSVCGAMDINSFEIKSSNSPAVAGIFPATAMMAHNCIPNMSHVIDEQDRVTVRAAVPIQKGENLFVSYTLTLRGTIERRSTLRQSKFFECNCARCADPTECQTYLSAFKCQKCSVGNVLPLKPLQLHTNWRCDRCSYRLNAAVVARIDNQLNNEFDAIGPNDVQKFEDFLKRHGSLLHPNHYYFTSARQSLSQLYGRDSQFLLGSLSSTLLERKISLCRELLSVADVLEPGLTRLRGVTLYEMHAPIMMLATRQFDAEEISKEEFEERMVQVRRILKQCQQILAMEPDNSPEGVMNKASLTALEQMQQWAKFD